MTRQIDGHTAKRFLRPVTYGVGVGAVVCFLLLSLMATLVTFRDCPQGVVSVLATISFVGGGLAAGFLCAVLSREKGLLLGLLCGGCLFLMLLAASMLANGPGFGAEGVSKLAAVLLASAIGGVVGVNKKKKFK